MFGKFGNLGSREDGCSGAAMDKGAWQPQAARGMQTSGPLMPTTPPSSTADAVNEGLELRRCPGVTAACIHPGPGNSEAADHVSELQGCSGAGGGPAVQLAAS